MRIQRPSIVLLSVMLPMVCLAIGQTIFDHHPLPSAHAAENLLMAPQFASNDVQTQDSTTRLVRFVGTGQEIGSSVSNDVALGDVNGDGHLDAFVGNQGVNKLWLNDGEGIFSDSGQFLGSSATNGVALGDLDGDGDLDVVLANTGANQIGNNSDGTFIIVSQPRSAHSFDVALGDLNSDGFLDMVIANDGENYYRLNLGEQQNGAIQFGEAKPLIGIPAAQKTTDVALADLEKDGCLDIVLFPDGVYMSDKESDGVTCSGTFIEPLPIFEKPVDELGTLAEQPNFVADETRIAIGDLDLDGAADIYVGGGNGFYFKNRSASGTVTFTLELESFSKPKDGSDTLFDVALGDLDLDGDLDAFFGQHENSRNTIAINEVVTNTLTDSTQTFNIVARYAANFSQAVALGDLNGDGLLDAFVLGGDVRGNGPVPAANQVLLNTKAHTIDIEKDVFDISKDFETQEMHLVDLNGDAYLDAVLANVRFESSMAKQGEVILMLNDKQGGWINGNVDFLDGQIVRHLAFGDVDNDDDNDMVVTNQLGEIALYINQGESSGDFARSQTAVFTPTISHRGKVALGYFNDDDVLDLFAVDFCGTQNCLANKYVFLLDADSNAILDADVQISHTAIISGFPSQDVELGDYDDDGDTDAFVLNYWNRPNQVFLNDGNGNFSDSGAAFGRINSLAGAKADLDGDGDLDLVELRYNNGLTVWWNEGGRFAEQGVWWGRGDFGDVKIADINGDGRHDIIISTEQENATANAFIPSRHVVLLNLGGRTFDTHTLLDEKSLTQTVWGDLDNDGDIDGLLAYDGGVAQATNVAQGGQAQTETGEAFIRPGLAVSRPAAVENDLGARFAPNILIDSDVIEIPFVITQTAGRRVGQVKGFFSFNGGGQWFPAISAAEHVTDTVHLESGSHIFYWDALASGFYGQSDNVVFRLEIQPQTQFEAAAGTHTFVNQGGEALLYTAVATTPPFRVRGMQIHVTGDSDGFQTEGLSSSAGAFVYRRPNNQQQALIMASPTTGRVLTTDNRGVLGGRGVVQQDDELLAILPMTQTYRFPPALSFQQRQGVASVQFSEPLTVVSTTAELWAQPLTLSGTLLTLDDALTLTYQTDGEQGTQFTVTADDTTLTTTAPLAFVDGEMHHIALSLQAGQQSDNLRLNIDGGAVLTGTALFENGRIEAASFRLGGGFIGRIDEVRLWEGALNNEEIAITDAAYREAARGFWAEPYGQNGRLLTTTASLLAYWPIEASDASQVKNVAPYGDDLALFADTAVSFKPHYTVYYSSAAVTPDGVAMHRVNGAGVQTLVIDEKNVLLLFDLDVSLEWDSSNDPEFLAALHASFARASELLYDVTNGQVALRRVNFYYEKAFWGQSDIVIYADNGLRPSAAIGGVVNEPASDELIRDEGEAESSEVETLYLPGHIRMGTVWDPFGEQTAELGEEWSRALAHELSHYLFFLPDNYLGYETVDELELLRLVNCVGSFMTNNIEPSYSEFLGDGDAWLEEGCRKTVANNTTGRSDWETITRFYPMLRAPAGDDSTLPGPELLPINVLETIAWRFSDADETERPLIDSRYFVLRDEAGKTKQRLPFSQLYLIQTHDPDNLSDDLLIKLGNPVAGGDRIRVRGAALADRLLLIGEQHGKRYIGDAQLTDMSASLDVKAFDEVWRPQIFAESDDGRVVTLTVSFPTTERGELKAQVYPMHYMAFDGLSPVSTLESRDGLTFSSQVTLTLPAYEIAVRVWIEGQAGNNETISLFRLSPSRWANFAVPYSLTVQAAGQPALGGPINMPTGGPINMPTGGPINMPTGGPINMPTGGPINMPTGGPINMPTGGPINMPTGGPARSAYAPVLSADAQFVVYSGEKYGFYDDNGIRSLQTLANVPNREPWLIPVGQAYAIESDPTITTQRLIAFNYLQRDVPEGFEETVTMYFLPNCDADGMNCGSQSWQRLQSTRRLVENVAVAPLVTDEQGAARDGVYALFSTVELPTLQPGWNLFSYPLLVPQGVITALASIEGKYGNIFEVTGGSAVTLVTVLPNVQSLNIRTGPGVNFPVVSVLRANESATYIETQNNWAKIECPYFVANPQPPSGCWVSGFAQYVTIEPNVVVQEPGRLLPGANGVVILEEDFKPNRVYWIYITDDEPVPFFLAPPIRQPDGTLGTS